MERPALKRIASLQKHLLDALFPIFCFSCQKEGFWLCEKCLAGTKILDHQLCPACENQITEKGFLCRTCKREKKSSLDGLIAAASYENTAVKKLIHNFKYRFLPDIADPLSRLMTRALLQNDAVLPDFLIPVPLHRKRLRWRGFNQSFLLAEKISTELAPPMEIEVLDILERTRHNQPQMGIRNYQTRLENVHGIFSVKARTDSRKLKGKKILLIDDICTTGATLGQCAKILKAAGAKKVFAAVLARQTLKK